MIHAAHLLDDAEALSGEVLGDLPPYEWGSDLRGKQAPETK